MRGGRGGRGGEREKRLRLGLSQQILAEYAQGLHNVTTPRGTMGGGGWKGDGGEKGGGRGGEVAGSARGGGGKYIIEGKFESNCRLSFAAGFSPRRSWALLRMRGRAGGCFSCLLLRRHLGVGRKGGRGGRMQVGKGGGDGGRNRARGRERERERERERREGGGEG